MKILITGGCGFVGSNIAIFLKKNLKKAQISSLDNLFRKGSKINKIRLKKSGISNYNIDIKNSKKINKTKKFDLIIDCCAEPAIEESSKNPDRVFNTNLIGTFNILKKCVKDKSNIIFLSSSRVYSIVSLRKLIKSKNFSRPITSRMKVNEKFETSSPNSLYGYTKLSSENLIKEFSYTKQIKYIINRFGVIAGPWQFGKQDQGFISLWTAKHMLNRRLKYIGFGGFGNQVRDIIHIDDVCKIVLLQVQKFKIIHNDIFNIGGGLKNKISLRKLTEKCQVITGNKIKIGKQKNTSKFDIPYFVTDNSKIKKTYKWQPTKNIDQVIKDVYKWLIKNKNIRSYFI